MIPMKVMMTLESAKQTSELQPIIQRPEIIPSFGLALHVMYEKLKGKDSFWAPYLNVLPTTFSTPLYYSIEDFQSLKGSSIESNFFFFKKHCI